MRNDRFSRQNILLYSLGGILAIWLALLVAPIMGGGIASIIANFGEVMNHPFRIQWCEDSLKTVLLFVSAYGLAIVIYLSSVRNYRRREEHGSAKWGTPNLVNSKYADRVPTENKLLTQNVSIGLDGRKHRRNLNILVCGGSGSGKTRFFAKPNIMNANTSFVCLDPNGYNLGG